MPRICLIGLVGICFPRSQFSNLLPILVLALGIDDSLHALHRYKEERQAGKSPKESAQITLHRIGLAIMLTSVTTMAAFSANLFSDVAALRSFGIEAGFGILAAFLLTGMWTPLLRLSVDEWMEKKSMATTQDKTKHMVSVEKLQTVTKFDRKNTRCILDCSSSTTTHNSSFVGNVKP